MALDRRCCARPSRAFRASLQRGLGWRGPALWASGVSELRHEGAAGRTTWMPVVGLADETSAHEPALRYISRSLVSAPAVHHRASRWRRPAAGWGGCIHLLSGRRDVRVNLGDC